MENTNIEIIGKEDVTWLDITMNYPFSPKSVEKMQAFIHVRNNDVFNKS